MIDSALYLHLFIKNVPESETSSKIKEDEVIFFRKNPNPQSLYDLISLIKEKRHTWSQRERTQNSETGQELFNQKQTLPRRNGAKTVIQKPTTPPIVKVLV